MDGPALLLLHGWTATADATWRACYPALADRFRILAPEHPHHDPAALLDGPAIVVGYAAGGIDAQLLWQRHRPLVAGLVLCATGRGVPGIDVPTACVITTRDRVVPVSRQRALAASIVGATVHEVDGGHAVCVADADRFVPALLAALDSVWPRIAVAA